MTPLRSLAARRPPRIARRSRPGAAAVAACLVLAVATAASAQEGHVHADRPVDRPHFTHPLVTEAVTPGTEAGMELVHALDGTASHLAMSLGYAFGPNVGVEVELPLPLPGLESRGGEAMHAGLHLASGLLARHGVMLGYGLELELPLGASALAEETAAGHAGASLRPFAGVGIKRGGLEVTAGARLGLRERDGHDDAGTARHETGAHHDESAGRRRLGAGYSVSALHPVGAGVLGLVELHGGDDAGHVGGSGSGLYLAPGLMVRPIRGLPLLVGASVYVDVSGPGWGSAGTRVMFSLHP